MTIIRGHALDRQFVLMMNIDNSKPALNAEPLNRDPLNRDSLKKETGKNRWRPLTRKSDFQKNYGHGAKRVGRLVVVYFLVPKMEDTHPRFPHPDLAWAVVASKKVGNAVARNRAKRLMREARRTGVLQKEDTLNFLAAQFFRNQTKVPVRETESPTKAGKEGAPGEVIPAGQKTFAGLWIVLVARRNILSATSREVREELDTLLQSS